MPAEPIHVIYRSDASGTTDNFQQYLDAASNGAWGKGTGTMFNGGVGQGAKGNEGTSAAVKTTEGAITYNEWSFAQQERLFTAKIKTAGGRDPVAISERGRQDDRRRQDRGPRQRPGARHVGVLHADPA
jgi:phosphate transport system substrate-binding protein